MLFNLLVDIATIVAAIIFICRCIFEKKNSRYEKYKAAFNDVYPGMLNDDIFFTLNEFCPMAHHLKMYENYGSNIKMLSKLTNKKVAFCILMKLLKEYIDNINELKKENLTREFLDKQYILLTQL